MPVLNFDKLLAPTYTIINGECYGEAVKTCHFFAKAERPDGYECYARQPAYDRRDKRTLENACQVNFYFEENNRSSFY